MAGAAFGAGAAGGGNGRISPNPAGAGAAGFTAGGITVAVIGAGAVRGDSFGLATGAGGAPSGLTEIITTAASGLPPGSPTLPLRRPAF